MNVMTCGTVTAQQKLAHSEELCILQNRAERVKIVATRGVFKIQSQILIMRIANKVSELLWMATLPQDAPISLPAMSVRETKSKAWTVVGEEWREDLAAGLVGWFVFFLLFVSVPKLLQSWCTSFKASLISISSLSKHFTGPFSMGAVEILPSPLYR